VYLVALFSIVHFVASHGWMLRSLSAATRKSKSSPSISCALASVATCGSMTELSRICAQISVPPRFGGAVALTAVALGPPPVVGAHAASAAAPLNARNSRRFTSPFRLTVGLLMASLPRVHG